MIPSATTDPATIGRAVGFASDAHARQTRKRAPDNPRPRIPYFRTVSGVCALAVKDGGDTVQAIAGVLRHQVKDVDGADNVTLQAAFGPRVSYPAPAAANAVTVLVRGSRMTSPRNLETVLRVAFDMIRRSKSA